MTSTSTPSQPEKSPLAGIWIFIIAEMFLFGALAGAFAIWRFNHAAPYQFASQAFSLPIAAVGLISIFTIAPIAALASHFARFDQRKFILPSLGLIFILGIAFLGAQGVEYVRLAKQHLGFGASENVYSSSAQFAANYPKLKPRILFPGAHIPTSQPAMTPTPEPKPLASFVDPNANTPDAAKIFPAYAPIPTTLLEEPKPDKNQLTFASLSPADQLRVYTAYQWVYGLTFLLCLHVLIGLPLLLWLIPSKRSSDAIQSVALYWQFLALVGLLLYPLIHVLL